MFIPKAIYISAKLDIFQTKFFLSSIKNLLYSTDCAIIHSCNLSILYSLCNWKFSTISMKSVQSVALAHSILKSLLQHISNEGKVESSSIHSVSWTCELLMQLTASFGWHSNMVTRRTHLTLQVITQYWT